jgi:hypothetical protein
MKKTKPQNTSPYGVGASDIDTEKAARAIAALGIESKEVTAQFSKAAAKAQKEFAPPANSGTM